jgi:chromosome segregation ATPase
MMPTRAFVAESGKAFHAYAPTIIEEVSPFARMLPASNANLDAVAMRVSELESGSLEVDADIEDIREEIDKVASTTADAIEAMRDIVSGEIENVKDEINKVVADNDEDLSKILHIKKFDSILERDEWASSLDPVIKTKELSRTIVLVAQDNSTFEEFICVNPSAASLHSEDWDRLGAVDSIYAEHDKVGSVRLIANVEDVSFDSFIDDSMGDKVFPKKGLALAPIALKGLYDKHSAHSELINELKADLDAISEDTNNKIDTANSAIDVILKELEIKDSTDETTISRIDAIDKTISDLRSDVTAQMKTDFELSKAEINAIKDLIGTNGCECGKHDCHITDNKCTILCRIAENETDISNLNDQTLELNAAIIEKQAGIDANAAAIEALRRDTEEQITTITGFIDDKIDEHKETLANLNKHFEVLDTLTNENKENIFTIATTVDRLSDKVDSSEKRLEDIINSTTDAINGELNVIKTDISAIEGDINRLDSDINGQITSITAIESGLADVRANVDSNAVANGEAHSEIITRITKLESDYTSDKTYKQLLEADTIHGTQAYTQVTVLKSVVDELNAQMKYNTENITRFSSRLTTVENLVNDCNEKAGFAINTSTDALKASEVATETSQQAINEASDAVVSANEAKSAVEKSVTKIKELINKHQDAHTIQLDYKNGSENGVFVINMKDFSQFDSAYYNFAILETRENGRVVYPTVVYDGAISAEKADNRKITVTTGTNNSQTIITVHAYRAEMHVIEK